jgi:hypothetical protein
MVECSEEIRHSTRVSPELVGGGENGEAMVKATQSPEQGEDEVKRVRERSGLSGLVRPNRYAGFDQFGLTNGPRGIVVFLELVKMQ